MLSDRHATGASEVETGEAPGVGIEAGGQHQDIDLDMAGLGPHPGLGDLDQRVAFEVDERHVVAVEDVVEVLFQRRPLGPEGIRRLGGSQTLV